MVRNEAGELVEWGIEMGTPAAMLREGWRPASVKPGDPVIVVLAPLRSGNPGGNLIRAMHADGSVIGGKTVPR
jgi:hypothetical protein